MLRILFLVLSIILGPKAQAQTPIEIYANGHKYDSLHAYQSSQKSSESVTPASLNKQQEEYILQQAQQAGIKVDLNKVKTLQVGGSVLSDTTRHKLYVMSVEQGVTGALRDFNQTWSQPVFQLTGRISQNQLQDAIQQSVTTSKDPKLLISEPGKVRIMSLDAGVPSK